MGTLENQVKKANRRFYDIVGNGYEEIDGRRSERLRQYVFSRLEAVSGAAETDRLLDLGCGSGFIARAGTDLFRHRVGLDISPRILVSAAEDIPLRVVADGDYLPFDDAAFDCVATFAVLHHCFAYDKLISEIFRVLAPGGIYYSDHDLDARFYNRFAPLLRVYRRINNSCRRYLGAFTSLTHETYSLAEFHQNGIPSLRIAGLLRKRGFRNVSLDFHWYGLGRLTDILFGTRGYGWGFAPLVRITAVK